MYTNGYTRLWEKLHIPHTGLHIKTNLLAVFQVFHESLLLCYCIFSSYQAKKSSRRSQSSKTRQGSPSPKSAFEVLDHKYEKNLKIELNWYFLTFLHWDQRLRCLLIHLLIQFAEISVQTVCSCPQKGIFLQFKIEGALQFSCTCHIFSATQPPNHLCQAVFLVEN